MSTRPSNARTLSASRTGVRETPSSRAKLGSSMKPPKSPSTIRSRMMPAISSCRDGRGVRLLLLIANTFVMSCPRSLSRSGDRRHLSRIDAQQDLLASVKGFVRSADDTQTLSPSRERHNIFPIFSEKRGFEYRRRHAHQCLIMRHPADRLPAGDADILRSERERDVPREFQPSRTKPFSGDRKSVEHHIGVVAAGFEEIRPADEIRDEPRFWPCIERERCVDLFQLPL